jgi:hypothetical protein
MARMEALNRRSDLRAHLARTPGSGSPLEVDAWIPSEVEAISPLVDRLMRLIEGSHCIIGEEHDVELALREALSNAVVYGNRQDARRLVHVRCRARSGAESRWLSQTKVKGLMRAPFPIPCLSKTSQRSTDVASSL